ncbi:hypothetical protein [Moraxella sp. ZY200743]|uniref:hypothetical protein n=1 Tax=Moraxella sp. ZY200743 TaxID=2911970 RepID=UPI003D7D671F
MIDQRTLEYYFHPSHIKQAIIDDLKTSFANEINQSIKHIKTYIDAPEQSIKRYERKQVIKDLPLYDLILDILSTVSMNARTPIPVVSIANMITLDNMPKYHSIQTVCELLIVLSQIPYFTLIGKKWDMRTIQTNITLPQIIQDRLNHACYLPPMVEKPKYIKNNHTSGYLTFNDSVILGYTQNQHDMPLSLDVLNTLNNNQYELDEYILNNFTKPWHRDELDENELSLLSNSEQQDYYLQAQTFNMFVQQFEVMTKHLRNQTLYFTHKYDKRGRVYSQGYHYNPQGSSFEKACLNLKTKEYITGDL